MRHIEKWRKGMKAYHNINGAKVMYGHFKHFNLFVEIGDVALNATRMSGNVEFINRTK